MIKIEIFYVILGLFIGFFIIYITSPPPQIILKYPTIGNGKNTTYVDENGIRYQYFATEVPCKPNKKFMVVDKP
jgi:hypothetical protein